MSFYPSAGFSDERVHLFAATDLYECHAETEENERIEIVPWPLDDLDGAIAQCSDAKTLIAPVLAGAQAERAVAHSRSTAPGGEARRMTPPGIASPSAAVGIETLILDFLAYLELERGLSRNTLAAYRSDLLQFGEFLQRRGLSVYERQPRRPGAVPGRAERRQRHPAAGGGLDGGTQDRVPALLLPPPAPRGDRSSTTPPPTCTARASPSACRTCSRAATWRACWNSPRARGRWRCATGRCLEVMYACGLRASEAVGLELGDVDLEEGLLCARGKGSKERLVPIGRQAVERAVGATVAARARSWWATVCSSGCS